MPVIKLTQRSDHEKIYLNPDDITKIEGTSGGASVIYRRGITTPDVCTNSPSEVAEFINNTGEPRTKAPPQPGDPKAD